MEAVTSEAPPPARGRAWHERGWVRGIAVVVVAVGVGLLVFGVAALMSAGDTDDTAATTEDQVAVLVAETAALEAERDEALAAAEAASDAAERLTSASIDVQSKADDLELVYGQVIESSNAMAACGNEATTDAEFLQCTRDALSGFQSTTAELETATTALQDAIAALDGELR